MDVESQMVGGAVHEVFFDEGLGVVLGCRVILGDEIKGDEGFLHFREDLLLVVRDEDTRAEDAFREAHDCEDGIIDLALAGGESSGDGDGAGHVRVPSGVFRSYVEKEKVAVL